MIKLLTSILIFTLLSGCAVSTGYHSRAEYTGSSNHASRVDNVLIYYQGSTIEWPHEQLGLVTAIGDRHASTSEVMAHLKVKAQRIGADAIVNVRSINRQRESGLVFSDDRESYQAVAYEGVAIRFDDIESLPESTQSKLQTTDTRSQKIVSGESESRSSSMAFDMVFSLVLGIAYLLTL